MEKAREAEERGSEPERDCEGGETCKDVVGVSKATRGGGAGKKRGWGGTGAGRTWQSWRMNMSPPLGDRHDLQAFLLSNSPSPSDPRWPCPAGPALPCPALLGLCLHSLHSPTTSPDALGSTQCCPISISGISACHFQNCKFASVQFHKSLSNYLEL